MAVPSHKPLQLIPTVSVKMVITIDGAMVAESVFEHPIESVTVIQYVPGHKVGLVVCVVSAVTHHKKDHEANEPVPPVGFTVACPSQLVAQLELTALGLTTINGGSIMVMVSLPMQPFVSVTVT